jgi:hypothetical protein
VAPSAISFHYGQRSVVALHRRSRTPIGDDNVKKDKGPDDKTNPKLKDVSLSSLRLIPEIMPSIRTLLFRSARKKRGNGDCTYQASKVTIAVLRWNALPLSFRDRCKIKSHVRYWTFPFLIG